MTISRSQHDFFATAALGTEELLLAELNAIGIEKSDVNAVKGGVKFRGSLELGYRVCLWSRIANRVLLPLKTFSASTVDELYEGVQSVDWEDHLDVHGTLAVDFTTTRSQITHSHFGALKVKDAIVDQFRTQSGERPSVDTKNPQVRIHLYLNQDQATVSIDLSGDSLHRRGYRGDGVAAPLKENLAAAILMLAGWPKSQNWAFLDPMCGSGTLPIEAGLMSAHRAPGLGRENFGFMGWQGHVPVLWKRLIQEAKDLEIREPRKMPKIVGYDRDFRSVRTALTSVDKAGLRGKVHIEKRQVSECDAISAQGIFVVNPPYGERLGEVEALRGLYAQLGDLLKQKFAGWQGFILTGSSVLGSAVHLKPARRYVLFNGAIECRLLKYELYSSKVL